MSVGCIISLAIFFAAIGVLLKVREEIAMVLFASIAGLSLILVLVLMSWPVQLLLLLVPVGLYILHLPDDRMLS